MKFISFELTMPNRGSWNGRWSGESSKYFIIRKVADKFFQKNYADKLNLSQNNNNSNFYYRWEDGWGANVNVCLIDSKESRRRLKISAGFCGYNWMVESILKHGKIYASHEEIPKAETESKESQIVQP